tara:strand:+ start:5586 stop:5780 length:195 start_codon:yes stop_codon:yes gene_type:complete
MRTLANAQPDLLCGPCWDKEAGVFYSESDIEGLHVEADTLENFREAVPAFAAELIVSNHMNACP